MPPSAPDDGHDLQGAPARATFNIVFVCTGNTCRSPMAEGIARSQLEQRGWRHVRVASAGVAAATGAPASPQAVEVAGRHGVDLSQHRSQPLTPELAGWADLILAMGPSHRSGVEWAGGSDRAAMLAEFADPEDSGRGVSDPYGGPVEVYERTFAELSGLISRALDRLAPILHP
jgi:protein-tyrosine-phosphatase